MSFLVKFKDLLVEALRDNKRLIIGLYVLFIIVFIAAFFLYTGKMANVMSNISVSGNGVGMNVDDAIGLFIHNVEGGILTYIGSIFFAIPAILGLVYNGINLGALGQLFNQMIPNDSLNILFT